MDQVQAKVSSKETSCPPLHLPSHTLESAGAVAGNLAITALHRLHEDTTCPSQSRHSDEANLPKHILHIELLKVIQRTSLCLSS